MATLQIVAAQLRAEFGKDPRIGFTHPPVLAYRNGLLLMEGEAVGVAAKKLALDCAARMPGVAGIFDRVLVRPMHPMTDIELVGTFGRALCRESAFAGYVIVGGGARGPRRSFRSAPSPTAAILFEVSAGVVTLTGQVSGLAKKRLAGVLAWGLGGTRDVVNGIAVDPPEEDDDAALTEAVRLALNRDPAGAGEQVQVDVRGATVFLSGLVTAHADKDAAARSAWCVLGVDEVIDRIMVGDAHRQ